GPPAIHLARQHPPSLDIETRRWHRDRRCVRLQRRPVRLDLPAVDGHGPAGYPRARPASTHFGEPQQPSVVSRTGAPRTHRRLASVFATPVVWQHGHPAATARWRAELRRNDRRVAQVEHRQPAAVSRTVLHPPGSGAGRNEPTALLLAL